MLKVSLYARCKIAGTRVCATNTTFSAAADSDNMESRLRDDWVMDETLLGILKTNDSRSIVGPKFSAACYFIMNNSLVFSAYLWRLGSLPSFCKDVQRHSGIHPKTMLLIQAIIVYDSLCVGSVVVVLHVTLLKQVWNEPLRAPFPASRFASQVC